MTVSSSRRTAFNDAVVAAEKVTAKDHRAAAYDV